MKLTVLIPRTENDKRVAEIRCHRDRVGFLWRATPNEPRPGVTGG